MKLSTLKKALPVSQRLVIYGPPKSGKTQLVSQLAEHFNLKWFDFENGMSPLLKLPEAWQSRIDICKIPDDKDVPMAIETALKLVSGAKGTVCAKHGKWNCALCSKDPAQIPLLTPVCFNELSARDIVVFDSLTQISNSALNWVMRDQPSEAKPERDQWGALKFIMESKLLTKIQTARYNIICITHEDEVEMVDGRDKLVPICGSRNSSRNTAKYFDHVVYCNVVNKKHAFGSATTYAASILAGSRLDVSIESLTIPSLLPFFSHLLEFDAGEAIQPPAPEEISADKMAEITAAIKALPLEEVATATATATATNILNPTSAGSAALERLKALKAKGKR